jgi:hypothetical protein
LIPEVDDRDAAPHRDLLRPQLLGDRLGPPAPGLHRRVVRHDDHGPATHLADTRHDAYSGGLSVVLVVRDQEADLEEAAAGVDQQIDPLTGRELALGVLALDARLAAALAQSVF